MGGKKMKRAVTGDYPLKDDWEHAYQHTRRNLRTRRERIAFFRLPLHATILDYGCGDGLDLQCFHDLGYRGVLGIDYSAGLLRDLAGQLIVQGDCERTPFADQSFDAVFVNSVFHHLNVDRAIAEVKRILKPGGTLCLIEPRSGFPRRVLDFVTCSPFGAIVPSRIIRHRRIAVRIEYPEYSSWLRRDRRLLADLRAQGFQIVDRRKTLFSILVAANRGF